MMKGGEVAYLFCEKLIFPKNHEKSEKEHDESVARVAEHHREEEWKSDDAEGRCKTKGGWGVEVGHFYFQSRRIDPIYFTMSVGRSVGR